MQQHVVCHSEHLGDQDDTQVQLPKSPPQLQKMLQIINFAHSYTQDCTPVVDVPVSMEDRSSRIPMANWETFPSCIFLDMIPMGTLLPWLVCGELVAKSATSNPV